MSEIAMVTGAATGIGAATARMLAQQGARVAVCDVNADAGQAVARDIDGIYLNCDVRDFASVAAARDACVEQFGVPTRAHLNAGIMTVPTDDDFLPIENVSLEAYQRIIGVNLDGVFHGIKALLPLMRAGDGAITVTASIAAFGQLPVDPLYSATKHALIGLVRSIAAANEQNSLRVNAICPGVVDTPIVPGAFRGADNMMPPEELAVEVLDLLQNGRNGEIRAKVSGRPAFEVPAIDIHSLS